MLGRTLKYWSNRGHQSSKMVTIRISYRAAEYLRDMLLMDIEATATARGLTINDKNIQTAEELLDIMDDYTVSASYQKEVLKCLNSTLT